MIRKGGAQRTTRGMNWVGEWKRNPAQSETQREKKKPANKAATGREADFFNPPSNRIEDLLMWNDTRTALYITERASRVQTMAKRRESMSLGRLATGQLFGLLGTMAAKRCTLGTQTYNEVLKYLSWGGNLRQSLSILETMTTQKVDRTPDTYKFLINACARDFSASDTALQQVLEDLKRDNIPKTDSVWIAVLRYYSTRGNFSKTKQLWAAMEQQGFEKGPHAWSLMISSCPDVATAKIYLNECYTSGFSIRASLFQSVFKAAAREGNPEEAEKLFAKLKPGTWMEWLGHRDKPPRPINTGLELIHAFLSVFSKLGLVESLKRHVKLLEKLKLTPNNITLGILLEGNAVLASKLAPTSPRMLGIDEYTKGLIHQAISNEYLSCRRLYTMAMTVYSHTGNVSAARSLRDTASNNGVIESEVYLRCFEKVFETAGQQPDANEIQRRMPNVKSRFDFVNFTGSSPGKVSR